jgi:phosphoglucomutase
MFAISLILRYHNDVAAQLVIRMAAANNVKRVLVSKDAIFSTPAISASVRARKATGAYDGW